MAGEFEGKRFTTLVKMSETTNCVSGQTYKKPEEYYVYDNTKGRELHIPNFHPKCYEDIRQKAIELNNKIPKDVKYIYSWNYVDTMKEHWLGNGKTTACTIKKIDNKYQLKIYQPNNSGAIFYFERLELAKNIGLLIANNRVSLSPEKQTTTA